MHLIKPSNILLDYSFEGDINKKKEVKIKEQMHNSLLRPMNGYIYFHVGKYRKVALYFKERLQVKPAGNNKQATGVCVDFLLSTVVMSLNTGYGLYWSYIKMTDGLHISLHTSLLMKPTVTCQMQLKHWTRHWWTRPSTDHWKRVDFPWLNWCFWL